MDAVALILAVALPWCAGCAALLAARWLTPSSAEERAPGRIATLAGYGYFVGILLVTGWMRLLSIAGIGFGRLAIAGPLALGAALAIYLARARRLPFSRAPAIAWSVLKPPLPRWQQTVWIALLAWMALRFATLGIEVAVRPLYPWDAWTQWATKARVWYELGHRVPFATADTWLAGAGGYFDAAPGKPATLPLLQTWSAIALGRWDDSAINWPWLFMLIGLTLAIYGMLRDRGLPPLGALTGASLVASLPLLDTHVALAGYPDLMLGATYTLAALALARWASSRDPRDGLVAMVFALAGPTIDASGGIWMSTLLPGAVVALWPRSAPKLLAWSVAAAVLALAVLAREPPLLPAFIPHLSYRAPWGPLGDAYFLADNWHLLWYGALAVAAVRAAQLLRPGIVPLTAIAAAALAWVLVASMFRDDVARWFPEAVAINRPTLALAPLIAFLCIAVWHEPVAPRLAGASASSQAQRAARIATTLPDA